MEKQLSIFEENPIKKEIEIKTSGIKMPKTLISALTKDAVKRLLNK